MKTNGAYELHEVPGLLEQWRTGSKIDPRPLVNARAALLTACETLMNRAGAESRALTPDERIAFDDYSGQMHSINDDLAAYEHERRGFWNGPRPISNSDGITLNGF